MLLPSGHTARPATPDDIPDIHRLVVACEENLHGHSETDADGIASVFARAGFDLALDTVLIHDPAQALMAWAWSNRRSEVDVHPAARDRGIGQALLDWTQDRGRAAGSQRLVQTVEDRDHAAVALVKRAGFTPKATSWQLMIEASHLHISKPMIDIMPLEQHEWHTAYEVCEDAFDDWQERRKGYAEWATQTVERSAYFPQASMAAYADGRLVGVVIALAFLGRDEGYVERVAVHRDYRKRGIASLLLRHTFAAFHRMGRPVCALWTHSGTGALALYEKVGMTVRRSSTVYAKELSWTRIPSQR